MVVGRDKFPTLYKLLLKHKARIEFQFSEIRYTENHQGDVFATEANSGRKWWCWLHPNQNEHPIWRCKGFLGKTIDERISLVRSNKASFHAWKKAIAEEDVKEDSNAVKVFVVNPTIHYYMWKMKLHSHFMVYMKTIKPLRRQKHYSCCRN